MLKNVKPVVDHICNELQDFVSSTGFSKVLVGVSGGLDSAVVISLAVRAFDPKNVFGIYMPSKYSSELSDKCYKELVRSLRFIAYRIHINDLHKSYLDNLGSVFIGQLTGTVADENLQARIRGNILMTFSNMYSALVLNTGNKTEGALGYCTLYGDTVGSIAPIGDLYKEEVYQLAKYLNVTSKIRQRAPTAELSSRQTDEQELGSYKMLDRVVECYLKNKDVTYIEKETGLENVKDIIGRIEKNKFKSQQCPPVIPIRNSLYSSIKTQ